MTTERPFKLGGYEGVSRSEPKHRGQSLMARRKKPTDPQDMASIAERCQEKRK